MKNRNQRGAAHIILVLVVVVVAAVAFVGYRVYRGDKSANQSSTTSSQTTAQNVSNAPAVKSTTDLDQAQQTLDQNDPSTANSSDSAELDSQLSGF